MMAALNPQSQRSIVIFSESSRPIEIAGASCPEACSIRSRDYTAENRMSRMKRSNLQNPTSDPATRVICKSRRIKVKSIEFQALRD
jgi:hypothetical protein